MLTLKQFIQDPVAIPAMTVWNLSDLGEAKGKQELFAKQSPQRLEALREHALIESAVSSNRIEGVRIDPQRTQAVLFGRSHLRDRDEEEVRGYREALKWIHEEGPAIGIDEKSILRLHRLVKAKTGDAGRYKEKDGDIIEKHQDGRVRVRFKTVPARETPGALGELIKFNAQTREEWQLHRLVEAAVFNLDFLCIHPFRDGNGRVSRLLFLLQCRQAGYEVGRFISLERLIEENKERYYETLEESSRGWHEGKQDPWPYVNYLLFILRTAYREFESRVGTPKAPKGAKTEVVLSALEKKSLGPFRMSDLRRECPGVGMDMIRKVLKDLKAEGRVICLGRGKNAQWKLKGKW